MLIYYVEDDASIRGLVIYTLRALGMQAEGFERPAARALLRRWTAWRKNHASKQA